MNERLPDTIIQRQAREYKVDIPIVVSVERVVGIHYCMSLTASDTRELVDEESRVGATLPPLYHRHEMSRKVPEE